jgi:hypothetical protein
LLKPGKLTQAYVAGKRVAFIHPIRLYIFISIIFFLVVLSGQANRNEAAKEPAKAGITTLDTVNLAKKKLTAKQLKENCFAERGNEIYSRQSGEKG